MMRELVKPRGLAIFSDGRDRIYLDARTKALLSLLTAGGEFEQTKDIETDVVMGESGSATPPREMRVIVLERRHVFPNPSRRR